MIFLSKRFLRKRIEFGTNNFFKKNYNSEKLFFLKKVGLFTDFKMENYRLKASYESVLVKINSYYCVYEFYQLC